MLLLTFLDIASWAFFISTNSGSSLSTRIILTLTGASGQIVVTLTLFGAFGLLKPAPIAIANILLSTILLFVAARNIDSPRRVVGLLKRDLNSIRDVLRAALAWETVLLAVILAFAGIWIATVIAFYPPRGIDDVTYHLPPIYQSVQDGRLALLPVGLRGHFAYPLNGELLFAWIVLFTHDTRWIDAPQVLFGLLCSIAVFALARRFSLAAREAFLASALFAAMPVALLQAPTVRASA
jgi:hypothetical protein